jgi:hypothetical protein
MVKEAGYEMNTKIMGAVNKIIVRTLEPTNKDPTYMAMVDSDLTFNHFPPFPSKYKIQFFKYTYNPGTSIGSMTMIG